MRTPTISHRDRDSPESATNGATVTVERRRWLALLVLCLGELMIVLDGTIVNVALPSIRADLGCSETSLAWVVNIYMLTFGGFLLLAGRMGDFFGHRRLFLIGLAVFTCASLACGLATSAEFLVVARAMQGLGGAAVSVVSLSLIMIMFTEPAERAKAMGFIGFVIAGGGSIGVLLGGVLTGALNWHWIFLVNIPIGAAVIASCLVLLPAVAGQRGAGKLDVAGSVTVTAALMIAVYAIMDGNHTGWASARTIGLLVVALALLGCSSASRPARNRRSYRLGCSDSAVSPPQTSSVCCGQLPCSHGSSCPPSTCNWCSATARSRSVSHSCRRT